MSIWAPISFIVIMGGYIVVSYIIDTKTTKRLRTKEEQNFVDWCEFVADYGFPDDLSIEHRKRYKWIIKHTVWKPFNR